MRRIERAVILGLLLFGTVACDQVTKHVAQDSLRPGSVTSLGGGLLRLQLAENPGAFLSLGASLGGAGRFAIFTVGVGGVLLALLAWAIGARDIGRAQLAGCALAVGGGASNLVDRLWRGGRVVDFMNLHLGPAHTGIFNAADVAIMVGMGLLLLSSRRPTASRS